MAELTITGAAGARPGAAADPAGAFLAGLADGWRAWRRYRHLRRMSDAELARLGLARTDDLARYAVFGAADPAGPDESRGAKPGQGPSGPLRRSR